MNNEFELEEKRMELGCRIGNIILICIGIAAVLVYYGVIKPGYF